MEPFGLPVATDLHGPLGYYFCSQFRVRTGGFCVSRVDDAEMDYTLGAIFNGINRFTGTHGMFLGAYEVTGV